MDALKLAVLAACLSASLRAQELHFDRGPFIHPKIIQDLCGWVSDKGDQVLCIDLAGSQNSNRYFGEIQVRETKGERPYVFVEEGKEKDGVARSSFGYRWIGRTKGGVDVLMTAEWTGGTGVFENLLLLKAEDEAGAKVDFEKKSIYPGKSRRVLKKVSAIILGDRWKGALRVEGDSIFIGKDEHPMHQGKDYVVDGRRVDLDRELHLAPDVVAKP